jgi:putative addiction module component (TIGR02574 family)
MGTNTQTILDAALALPEDDRELIVERLLESLPLTTDGLDDAALSAELKRRKAEHERDPSVARPWSEIKHLR